MIELSHKSPGKRVFRGDENTSAEQRRRDFRVIESVPPRSASAAADRELLDSINALKRPVRSVGYRDPDDDLPSAA